MNSDIGPSVCVSVFTTETLFTAREKVFMKNTTLGIHIYSYIYILNFSSFCLSIKWLFRVLVTCGSHTYNVELQPDNNMISRPAIHKFRQS